MKAIKIDSIVNLTNGLVIPVGAVCVISEGLAQVFAQKDGLIPAQIVSQFYTSVANYESGKAPVDGSSISYFNPAMYGLNLSVVDYQTQTAENVLVEAVYNALEVVYPAQCEIIEVVPPVVPTVETESAN